MLRVRVSVVPGGAGQHARSFKVAIDVQRKLVRERSIVAAVVFGGRYEVGSCRKSRESSCEKSAGEDAGGFSANRRHFIICMLPSISVATVKHSFIEIVCIGDPLWAVTFFLVRVFDC